MSITVIIKRKFRMDKTEQLIPLLKELREKSKQQPGFISRTTFSNVSDPGELIVIAEWDNIDSWLKWMDSSQSKELQWEIDSIIGEKTSFDVYMPQDY